MKEKIIILAGSLFLAMSTLSAKSLVLTLKNGRYVYYLLGKEVNPMLRFVDGDIVVNTDRYEFGDVSNFYISATDDPSGIESITGDGGIRYAEGMMVLDNAEALPVGLYTLDGHKVGTYPRQISGKTLIDLDPLPQGAYIVTIGETSLKILKK